MVNNVCNLNKQNTHSILMTHYAMEKYRSGIYLVDNN